MDGPITMISEKVNVDKAFVVVGIAAAVIMGSFVLGFGDFVMYCGN